jgi:hypothetical protein
LSHLHFSYTRVYFYLGVFLVNILMKFFTKVTGYVRL